MADHAHDVILLDIDGTLVDSTYHHAVAWQRAFHRNGLGVPLWRIHRTIGMGGDRLVAEVTDHEVEARLGDRVRSAWREEYGMLKAEVRPLPGAVDLVRKLSKSYRVALASSGDPEFSAEAVGQLGLEDAITLLTTSEDADESKPHPDLLGVTLEKTDGARSVLVGDTVFDVESAARAGLQCIAVRSGGYGEAELVAAGAALVVDGPEDLLDLDWEQYLRPASG